MVRHPRYLRTQDYRPLVYFHSFSDRPPVGQPGNLPLNPGLQRNGDIKLDLPTDQKVYKLSSKEAAIGPQADLLDMGRQFLKNRLQELLGLIRSMMDATSQKAGQVIPSLANKTKQGMIALPAFLLRIITQPVRCCFP